MVHVVAHMLCRNEVDVIAETVASVLAQVDTLLVLDGASDDGTLETLLELRGKYLSQGQVLGVVSRPDREGRFADDCRNELLEWTAEYAPEWIWSVDADEIIDPFFNVPKLCALGETTGANVIRAGIPEFYLTLADIRDGLCCEDSSRPVVERRRWYTWGWQGTFLWRADPKHYYPQGERKRTPEMPGQTWREWQRPLNHGLIIRHYQFRSLYQAAKRARERLERGGTYYFGKYAENWIIDEREAGLHHWDGAWRMEDNYRPAREWMGAHRREV